MNDEKVKKYYGIFLILCFIVTIIFVFFGIQEKNNNIYLEHVQYCEEHNFTGRIYHDTCYRCYKEVTDISGVGMNKEYSGCVDSKRYIQFGPGRCYID